MFDIGGVEILVVAVIAILVVGPKELPGLLRGFAKMIRQFKSMMSDVQGQFNEVLKEADMEDVGNSMRDLRSLDPRASLRSAMQKEIRDIETAVEGKPSTKKAKPRKVDAAQSVGTDTSGQPDLDKGQA